MQNYARVFENKLPDDSVGLQNNMYNGVVLDTRTIAISLPYVEDETATHNNQTGPQALID